MHRASEIEELASWGDPAPIHISGAKNTLRKAWKRKFGDMCQLCGCRMHFEARFRARHNYATIDHIIARALGGGDSLHNIQVACWDCNNKKSVTEYHSMPLDIGGHDV